MFENWMYCAVLVYVRIISSRHINMYEIQYLIPWRHERDWCEMYIKVRKKNTMRVRHVYAFGKSQNPLCKFVQWETLFESIWNNFTKTNKKSSSFRHSWTRTCKIIVIYDEHYHHIIIIYTIIIEWVFKKQHVISFI